jgi:hypothetical protein
VLWITVLRIAAADGNLATDFDHFFYAHGRDVLAGRTPAGAYPALTSVLFAPFALLPRGAADVAFSLLLAACAVGTLRALDVRDWRCYAALLLWYPVFDGVQSGNLSLLLTLGVALLWRWRDRPVAAGAAASLLVALKLFLWPVGVWLVVTRRWRALAIAFAAGALASVAGWAVVGFDVAGRFPGLVHSMVQVDGRRAYTVAALLQGLGASDVAAYAVSSALGVAVLAGAATLGLRGRQRASLCLVIGAALLLSPIVWAHYFCLLLVPVALARPRFDWLWLAPLPLWLGPPVAAATWQRALVLLVAGGIVALAAGSVADAPVLREAGRREVGGPVAREGAVA